MKGLKRFGFLCFVLTLLVFGNQTQARAAGTKDADEIIALCNKAMAEKKIIEINEYISMTGYGEERMLTMIINSETGDSYVEMFGIEFYLDTKNQLMYYRIPGDSAWYVSQSGGESEKEETEIPDSTPEADAVLTYGGTKQYRGIECEVIHATTKSADGEKRVIDYYINASTYDLYGVVEANEYGSVEIVWTYPKSFSIPDVIKQQAVIAEGDSIVQGKLEYQAVKSGKKTVLKARGGKKASGKITVPDRVTFAGKKYFVTGVLPQGFEGNKKITKVTLGKYTKNIGKKAFYKCTKLSQVTINSTKLKKVGKQAFYGTRKNLKLKVPKSKKKQYKNLIKKSGVSSKLIVSKI